MFKDIKQIIRHTLVYGAGNLASKLVGFILIPLYTDVKYFSIAEYGLLGILEVTSQLLIPIIGLSVYSGFMRWYWDDRYKDKQKSLFFTTMLMTTLSALFFGVIMFGLIKPISSFILLGNDVGFVGELPYIIKLLITFSVFSVIAEFPLYLLRLQNKSLQYSLINLIRLSVSLSATVYFIVVLKRGVSGIYEAQILGVLIEFLIFIPFIIKNIQIQIQWNCIKQILNFSYPLIFPAVLTGILSAFDRYMIGYMQGLDEVAFYSLGFKIGNTLRIFIVASVQLALTPLLMKKINEPDNGRFYSKVLTYFSYGLMFCVLCLNIFTKELVELVTFNDQYLMAVYVVPFVTFSILGGMMRDCCLIGLQIAQKTKIISMVIGMVAFLNIGLNMLFIPCWGIYGAAFATLLSQFISWLAVYYLAQKRYKIPYELAKVFKIWGVGIVLTLFGCGMNYLPLLLGMPLKIIVLCSYPFVLYLLCFYEPRELEKIKDIWIKWHNLKEFRNNIKSIKLD